MANLDRANFTKANLVTCNASYASFDTTNFTEVVCGESIFANTDLSKLVGIETILHNAPSTVGTDTIFLSKGKIPKSFLRGCGVPEILIEYIPYMMEEAFQYYSCFISYSHTDAEFAQKLYDALQERGIRCWLDKKQLKPGDDILEEIAQGVRYWDKLILCCSEDAIRSWWVHNEIEFGFQKEIELTRERGSKTLVLIPLNLDGYIFKDTSAKVIQLRTNRIVGDFQNWRDEDFFRHHIEEVVRALRTEEGREPFPESKL